MLLAAKPNYGNIIDLSFGVTIDTITDAVTQERTPDPITTAVSVQFDDAQTKQIIFTPSQIRTYYGSATINTPFQAAMSFGLNTSDSGGITFIQPDVTGGTVVFDYESDELINGNQDWWLYEVNLQFTGMDAPFTTPGTVDPSAFFSILQTAEDSQADFYYTETTVHWVDSNIVSGYEYSGFATLADIQTIPTTTPEPRPFMLFGGGLIGLAWIGTRKRFKIRAGNH
jgi:hypothetical protein